MNFQSVFTFKNFKTLFTVRIKFDSLVNKRNDETDVYLTYQINNKFCIINKELIIGIINKEFIIKLQ